MNKLLLVLGFLFITNLVLGQETVVYDVKIQGTKKTKHRFIINFLETKNGQALDSIVLNKDIIRLKRLPAISHASYQIFHAHDNLYNVFFNIEENFTIIPELNIWTTSERDVAYKVGVYDYNFLGKNIGFGGFYQNNGFDSYALNFRAPNLFSNTLGVAINHQDWKSREPLYFDEGVANYKYNNISFEILGLYALNYKNNFQFGVNFFNEKYNFLSGFDSDQIPQELDLKKTLFKVVYTYDNLNYFYHFIDGFKSEFYGQFVTSKDTFQNDFLVAWNDFLFFKRIKEKGNWASKLRIGLASNEKSPFAPFALDNNVNIRGVGFLVDRGTGSIVFNTEYRYTLYEKDWFVLQGNLFIDAGTWRNPGGELNDFVNSENIHVYSGGGLRFIHKNIYNAVFRIDYGFGLKKGESKGLVFGVGQYF
jgi:hypothetical protein